MSTLYKFILKSVCKHVRNLRAMAREGFEKN